MSDNIEQRFVTGGVNPDTNSELHKYPVLNDEEELLEMNEEFCLDDFQVVRREFFAHLREPAVTFNNRKFYVNSACLTKFPNTDYVQALINPDSKILALRPCGEGERGAFQVISCFTFQEGVLVISSAVQFVYKSMLKIYTRK